MAFSFDWKCGITTAILTVLIYLLFIYIGSSSDPSFGKTELQSGDWHKSCEFLLLIAAFIAYIVNQNIFDRC